MNRLLIIATACLLMATCGFAQEVRRSAHPVIVKRLILKNQTGDLGSDTPITFFTPEHVGVYRVTCGVQPAAQLNDVFQIVINVFTTASVEAKTYLSLGQYQPTSLGDQGNGIGGSFPFLGSPQTTFTFSVYTPTAGPPIPYDMYIIVEEL